MSATAGAQSDGGNERVSIASPSGGLTGHDRLRWVALTTFGPKNLAAGLFVAGIQTWRNEPEAWGPHWDGFGTRYGARLAAGEPLTFSRPESEAFGEKTLAIFAPRISE